MRLKNQFIAYIQNLTVRNVDAQRLFDIFFISAISSLLIVRSFLFITGYPQLGGGRFHIAHILWGGVIMAIALLLQFFFLSRSSRSVSAVLGGVGFGVFIDELGKFVTRDNNYLFQPAVAMIYLVFVLLFILVHLVEKRRGDYSDREYCINGLEMMKEMILGDMDEQEKRNALSFLEKTDGKEDFTHDLYRIIQRVQPLPVSRQNFMYSVKNKVMKIYRGLLKTPWFIWAIVIFFVVKTCLTLLSGALIISDLPEREIFTYISLGLTLANALSSGLVIMGILFVRSSRVRMFRFFRLSVLTTILITQPILFYQSQFGALLGLGINIVVYGILTSMIYDEEYDDTLPAPSSNSGTK